MFSRRPLLLFTFSTYLFALAHSLHFYLDANEKRCFIEELPSDTVVEGTYKAMEWSEAKQEYAINEELGINVQVEEVADGDIVVRSKGPADGRFTFTSHAAGDHSMCLSTNYTSWFSSTHIRCILFRDFFCIITYIGPRLYLDIAVGSTKPDAEADRGKIGELAGKVIALSFQIETTLT
jgi:p24 family protein alpha